MRCVAIIQRGYLKKYIKEYFKSSRKYLICGRSIHAIMLAQWAREVGIDIDINENYMESEFIVEQLKKKGSISLEETIENMMRY